MPFETQGNIDSYQRDLTAASEKLLSVYQDLKDNSDLLVRSQHADQLINTLEVIQDQAEKLTSRLWLLAHN